MYRPALEAAASHIPGLYADGYNEENGLWYKKQDEYFLPCIEASQEQTMRTGIWGERHRQYLKKYRRIRYCNLLTSGQLNAYLADVNSQAEKLFFQLVNEFAQMVMNLIY